MSVARSSVEAGWMSLVRGGGPESSKSSRFSTRSLFVAPIGEPGAVPTITALVAHPRRDGRYRLEVDGRVVATVDATLVGAAGLAIGEAFDAQRAGLVEDGAGRLAAFDKGLDALARRARSTRELERWLAARAHRPEHIRSAIERLAELGLLDDAEFARGFARSLTVARGMSRRRIQAELSRRGVERTLADRAVAEALEDESVDESAVVEQLARRKLRSLSGLDPAVQRRRLYGFLARRGHDADVVRQTVARVLTADP